MVMADLPFFSSQGSQYDMHQIPLDQENLASSPLRPKSEEIVHAASQKPRKPPTVTPKRFTKFFTPRSTLSTRGGRHSKAGRQLRDITKNGANRRRYRFGLEEGHTELSRDGDIFDRPLKRRKCSIDIASSPPQSSPLKHVQTASEIKVFDDVPTSPALSYDDTLSEFALDEIETFPTPVRRLGQASKSQRLLQRSFGGYDALTRGRRGADHCTDWRSTTANFLTTPTELHTFSGTALPFCAASCNTNSLIAIGEEEGSVRLIDSSASSDFAKCYLTFRPHNNAIMDIHFSSNDYMLATASGDQTARVVDMHTQQTLCILSGHKSSVKQVRFQPHDDNMVTTSSRDGSVQIWDLRCGGTGSVQSLRSALARNVDNGGVEPTVRYAKHTLDVRSAHRAAKAANVRSTPLDTEIHGVSITAVQHLSNGREHLLMTTSEVDASIKLWDLRTAGRRGGSGPLSSTPVPSLHNRTRNYGINAMALSGDGSRLYTVCRDASVYAYSTSHLILGCAPEMSSSPGKSRMPKTPKSGIGPLYAFRHPQLRIGSFYVKATLRPARGDTSEVLAVGSSEDCAVLFPIDERHLRNYGRLAADDNEEADDVTELPSLRPLQPHKSARTIPSSGLPVHEFGTPLVQAHDKEVTAMTWTYDGDLVTVSDDFTARCWREDGEKARQLRTRGEGGGERWRCGWAVVDRAWDEDEG